MNKWICSLLFLSIVITSCQPKHRPDDNVPNEKLRWQTRSEKIIILDENSTPLPSAQVLIGTVNSPDLWLQANQQGEILLPESWDQPETITIRAPEHTLISLINQSPSMQTIKLKKLMNPPQFKLQGNITGITTKDKDGYIDFALTMESFRKKDIFQFDINRIISPKNETITVAGYEIPTPENLFLPKQKESYIIPITLQKPNFILNFPDYGEKKITTLRGKFPFKKVLSDLQDKKPYYELVNYFEMISSSDTTTTFESNNQKISLPANTNLFNQTKTIIAPQIKADQVMLGLSCLNENSIFSPTDIKYFKSKEQLPLKATSSEYQYFVGILKNKSEFNLNNNNTERMSLVILPWNTHSSYQFLPLIENPKILAKNEFEIFPPTSNLNQLETGYSAIISELTPINLDDGKIVDVKIPQWEIHSAQWDRKITLPDQILSANKKYRLEVSFLSQNSDNTRKLEYYSVDWNHEFQLEQATHITKSAINF